MGHFKQIAIEQHNAQQDAAGFTSGPWSMVVDLPGVGAFDGYGINMPQMNNAEIAHVYSGPDGKANARLIAQAPAMYALLVRLNAWGDDPDRYGGDLADLAQEAKHILSEVQA